MKTESIQSATTSTVEALEFAIDFSGLIDLLSKFLYKDKSAAIRELLSNANDSLIRRKRESDFGSQEPMIRLWLDPQSGQLVVKDNGIGMSKDDLKHYLATIGASLTRKKENLFDGLIGRFGIGFLSAFIIADHITVETRCPNGPGYRWKAGGDRSYTIEEYADAEAGTKAVLDLKPEIYKEWDAEKIKKMVLENARNFVFPIYWGPVGAEKLNNLLAPWYSDQLIGDESMENVRNFLAAYDDRFASALNAPEIILVEEGTIRGVIYIPPVTVLHQEKVGAVDLYCKRVFVKKDDIDIVPREFPIIRGIIDSSNFQLTAARDEVLQNNLEYRSVVECIGNGIIRHLCNLAKKARRTKDGQAELNPIIKPEKFKLRLQSIMDQFNFLIKHAFVVKTEGGAFRYEDSYFLELVDFVPFTSSTLGPTTITEYLARVQASGRSKQIVTLRVNEDFPAQRAISEQERRECILIHHSVEQDYLDRYAKIVDTTCVPAADALKDSFPKLEATEGWDQIIKYYQERLNHAEFTLSVHLSTFPPDSVPGRMFADKDSEGQRRLQEVIKDLKANRILEEDDPFYTELGRLKRKTPHFLFINKRNPTLTRLAAMLGSGSALFSHKGAETELDLILHSIFHDIAIAAGHPVAEDHLTDYQTKTYGGVLNATDARQESNVLRAELDKYRKAQPRLTNEVFFSRPMKDGEDPYDFVSQNIQEVCSKFGLKFVDPKNLNRGGDIISLVLEYLRFSRFVIADISEGSPNVYFEAGYAHGVSNDKLVLIAEKTTILHGRLPFNVSTNRVHKYSLDAREFRQFMHALEQRLQEMTAPGKE